MNPNITIDDLDAAIIRNVILKEVDDQRRFMQQMDAIAGPDTKDAQRARLEKLKALAALFE